MVNVRKFKPYMELYSSNSKTVWSFEDIFCENPQKDND